MFRPTHFVILFAVFLCAYAAPAAEPSPAVEAPAKPAEKIIPDAESKDKSDLDTDAATYWRYDYNYGPRWGYYAPGLGGRTYGWGFGKSYDGWEPYVVYN